VLGRLVRAGSFLIAGAVACCLGVAAAPAEPALPVAVATPGASGGASCRLITYHSAPQLRAERACMNLGVTTHGTQPGTYLFLGPGDLPGRTGVGIFKDNGQLVWWQPATAAKTEDVNVVEYRGKPYLAIWSGQRDYRGAYGSATVWLYDEHYRRVGTITTGPPFGPNEIDAHEFRITPQGNALFGIDDRVSTTYHGRRVEVYQFVVQEVSLVDGPHGIHTGRVLFQWDSLDHVPLSQSYFPPPTGHAAWDYFHGNAVAQDTDGNLLVSARHTWGIYKINVKTGHIMWQVGGKGDARLAEPWCYQHDIVALGDNRYSLFDNGGSGPGCESGSTAHPARGLVVSVHSSGGSTSVKLIHAFTHTPAIYPLCCGGMQLLPDGGALIDWGNTPEVSEFDRDGQLRMDLSLSKWSYRAIRFAWTGEPLTRPAVASQRTAAATDVWASWNGSTEVSAWRVLAGASSADLSMVGSAVPSRSFETEAVLPHPYAYVAVQALGADGQVLATSDPVASVASPAQRVAPQSP
jgi:Arylsulfotransferase (ASST)